MVVCFLSQITRQNAKLTEDNVLIMPVVFLYRSNSFHNIGNNIHTVKYGTRPIYKVYN